jgi:rare lipoprotein A
VGSGLASYYGRELAGNRTASGERFNPSDLTAAHRTLPLGSKVRVTNTKTGESIIVRINDRGPFHSNRLIDLSEAAAREVGIRAAGSGRVELAVLAD